MSDPAGWEIICILSLISHFHFKGPLVARHSALPFRGLQLSSGLGLRWRGASTETRFNRWPTGSWRDAEAAEGKRDREGSMLTEAKKKKKDGGGDYLEDVPELIGHRADLREEVTDDEGLGHVAAPQSDQALHQLLCRLELSGQLHSSSWGWINVWLKGIISATVASQLGVGELNPSPCTCVRENEAGTRAALKAEAAAVSLDSLGGQSCSVSISINTRLLQRPRRGGGRGPDTGPHSVQVNGMRSSWRLMVPSGLVRVDSFIMNQSNVHVSKRSTLACRCDRRRRKHGTGRKGKPVWSHVFCLTFTVLEHFPFGRVSSDCSGASDHT
ncbi:unnamed protein product [Pleuronectes platessa]|uniref:Uncharacterized protein n=1 Tax=Pleuronectes platessa TaxID=8262 RepID=A0A9N7UW01_PLEPL|nr:unnamed protein product [Pleuronectes platessa]